MDDIFGGGDSETTVTYEIPPEQRELYRTIIEEIQALRPLVEKAVPDVQEAIQQYILQYQDWLKQTPEFFEQAGRQFDEITSQTEEQLYNLFFGGEGTGGKGTSFSFQIPGLDRFKKEDNEDPNKGNEQKDDGNTGNAPSEKTLPLIFRFIKYAPTNSSQSNQISQLGRLIEKRLNKEEPMYELFGGERTSPSNQISGLRGLGRQIEEGGKEDPNAPSDLRVIWTPLDYLLEKEFLRRQAQGDPDPHGSIMKELKELGHDGFMQKYGGSANNIPSKETPTKGIMNLLNQYIEQATGKVRQTWDEAIDRASGFWNEAIGQAGSYWDQAIGQAGSYWDQAIGQAGSYWDEVRRTLLQDIQEAEQKIPPIYEEAKKQTKELTQEVLQDALRNTIRKMALQGLVSQTAGTQAMAEQFRQYEYEPLQRLTETEAEARRRLEETALALKTDVGEKKAGTLSSLAGQKAGTLSGLTGQKAGTLSGLTGQKAGALLGLIGQEAGALSSLISQGLGAQETMLRDYASNIAKTQQASMALKTGLAQQALGFQLALPDIYNAIMRAQQQYALTPIELRRMLLGTLTGSVGPLQQLAPSNVTQSTSGGINPILGTTLGILGGLGMNKLFKFFGLL